jgi:adenylate kinase
MRVVLMGPPGAGKGTQAAIVSGRLGIPHVSTGDIFRANVAGGTPLGLEAQKYMDAGEYVPDSVTNEMVRDRLAQQDAAAGFLLDGYPRTVAQVDELADMLASAGTAIDTVVELTVDTDEVVSRLVKRAADQGRSDDTEDVIRRRQEIYREQTAPLTALYAQQGVLVQVDGMGDVDEVTTRVLDILGV